MSGRVFHRTVIEIEVLSEEMYELVGNAVDLDQVQYDISHGDCSGSVTVKSCEEVDGPTMAKLLLEQGSSPEFFMLDSNGNEVEDADV